VICYRSNAQRQELKLKFKSMYGRVRWINPFQLLISSDTNTGIMVFWYKMHLKQELKV
jgi:hypothetical protein